MANTVTYIFPAGATATTPPTAAQMKLNQEMFATITGDGATTTTTVTHNWGISAADNTNGFPAVEFEPLLAGYYGANPLVTTRAPNSVTITTVAFATAAIGVRLRRIWSALR